MTIPVAKNAVPHFAGALYGHTLISPAWINLAHFGSEYLNPGDRVIIAEPARTSEVTLYGRKELAGAVALPRRTMGVAAFSRNPEQVIALVAKALGLDAPLEQKRERACTAIARKVAPYDVWPARGELPIRASVGFVMPRDVNERRWRGLIDLIARSPYARGQIFSCITRRGEEGFAGPSINAGIDPKGMRPLAAGDAVTLHTHERSAVPASYHTMRLSVSYFAHIPTSLIPDPLGLSLDRPERASPHRWSMLGGIGHGIFDLLKEAIFKYYNGNRLYIWDGERMFVVGAITARGSRDAVVWRITYRDPPMGYQPAHHEIRAKNNGRDATVLRSLYASESYTNVPQTYALSASGREADEVLAIAEAVFDEHATRVAEGESGE